MSTYHALSFAARLPMYEIIDGIKVRRDLRLTLLLNGEEPDPLKALDMATHMALLMAAFTLEKQKKQKAGEKLTREWGKEQYDHIISELNKRHGSTALQVTDFSLGGLEPSEETIAGIPDDPTKPLVLGFSIRPAKVKQH